MLTLTPKQIDKVCSFILDDLSEQLMDGTDNNRVITAMRKVLGDAETVKRLLHLLLYTALSDNTAMYPISVCRNCGEFVMGGYECTACDNGEATYNRKEMIQGMLSRTSMSNVLFKEPITINEDGDNEHKQ